MAKKGGFFPGDGSARVLSDRDWVTIISSLLDDRSGESRRLAKKLLEKTRHGRQIAMLRLIRKRPPRLGDIQRTMRVSRRTVFRYLNHLEEHGVKLILDEQNRYTARAVPDHFRRVM